MNKQRYVPKTGGTVLGGKMGGGGKWGWMVSECPGPHSGSLRVDLYKQGYMSIHSCMQPEFLFHVPPSLPCILLPE